MSVRRKIINLILGVITCIAAIILTSLEAESKPSFKVEVIGNGKQSMILIPELTCQGENMK